MEIPIWLKFIIMIFVIIPALGYLCHLAGKWMFIFMWNSIEIREKGNDSTES